MDLCDEYQEACSGVVSSVKLRGLYSNLRYNLRMRHEHSIVACPDSRYFQDWNTENVDNSVIDNIFKELCKETPCNSVAFYILDVRTFDLLCDILGRTDFEYSRGMLCYIDRTIIRQAGLHIITFTMYVYVDNKLVQTFNVANDSVQECRVIASLHPTVCQMYHNARIHARIMDTLIPITDVEMFHRCQSVRYIDVRIVNDQEVMDADYQLRCWIAMIKATLLANSG
jgi:hypothetical protein